MSSVRLFSVGLICRARLLAAPQGLLRRVTVRPTNAVTIYLAVDQKPTLRVWQWQAAPTEPGSDKVVVDLQPGQTLWGITWGPLAEVQIQIDYLGGADPDAGVDSLLLLFQHTPSDEFDAIEKTCIERADVDQSYLTEAIEHWKQHRKDVVA